MITDFWYPFYPSKFKRKTRHLTAEQDGIYRRLIDEYMETRQPLPYNDVALARIAGVNENKWLDAAGILMAFFTHRNGMLYHEMCDEILDIQDKKTKRRSSASEKAAKIRWSKNEQNQTVICDTHTIGNAIAMPLNAIETETKTERIKVRKKNKQKKEIQKPHDVSNQVWIDFLDHRKKKKASVSETVISRFRDEAKKIGWTLEQAMIESAAQGWQGFKSDWVKNNATKGIQNGKNNARFTADDALKQTLARIDSEKENADSALFTSMLRDARLLR